MNESFQNITHAAQRKAVEKLIDSALSKVKKDREDSFLKMVDLAEIFLDASVSKKQFDSIRNMIKDPDNRWMNYIDRAIRETDPHVAKMTALNLGFEAAFRGTKMIRKNREKYGCNIPWLILFDPTSACNMHCTGCWSGTYGHKHSLSFEDMDKIVTQGKELGVYLYMLTGGEPLVRKKDIIKLAEKHNDVEFSIPPSAIRDIISKQLQAMNFCRCWPTKVQDSFFISTICQSEIRQFLNSCQHLSSENISLNGSDISVPISATFHFSQWISRMTANRSAAVLQAVEITSILIQPEMRNHASLSIIPMLTSMIVPSWKFCGVHYSWNIERDSHLIRIIFVRARCWKIHRYCRKWYIERAHTAPI